MTRNFANSIMKRERIRLKPNYVEIDVRPSFTAPIFEKFKEKIENDPKWPPLLTWLYIAESTKELLGEEPSNYDVFTAPPTPPRVGEAMTKWFESILPPYILLTSTFTDGEGWGILNTLIMNKDDYISETSRRTLDRIGVSFYMEISLKRPYNERELLKKIYDQGGLGITNDSRHEHVILLLENNGIPYEYFIKSGHGRSFDSTIFRIGDFLQVI